MERLLADAPGIDVAARALRTGQLVAFPTETVYGLGAAANQPQAVARLFAAKGRPRSHPLIVHLADADALVRFAGEVPAVAAKLAAAFWPGPLTLIVPRGAQIAAQVTGGRPTAGFRVPSHPVAQALLRAADVPVAAPSANRFGHVSATCAAHVIDDLGEHVDFVLDGGACSVGVESTIVDCTNTPRILRPGGVLQEQLEAVLAVAVPFQADGSTAAPGTLPAHYAPRTPVVLASADALDGCCDRLRQQGHAFAVFSVRKPAGVASASWQAAPAQLDAYARQLYAALRQMDDDGVDRIVVETPPAQGLGVAIIDRLRRAAVGSRVDEPGTTGEAT